MRGAQSGAARGGDKGELREHLLHEFLVYVAWGEVGLFGAWVGSVAPAIVVGREKAELFHQILGFHGG